MLWEIMGNFEEFIKTISGMISYNSKNFMFDKSEIKNGEGGIRTPGSREATLVFKTSTINHSVTSPICLANRPRVLFCTP